MSKPAKKQKFRVGQHVTVPVHGQVLRNMRGGLVLVQLSENRGQCFYYPRQLRRANPEPMVST